MPLPRILIVEDHPTLPSEVQLALAERCEAEVHVASSPAAARELVHAFDYALVVLDLNLIGGTGFEVLEAVRAMGSRAPRIVVTSAYLPDYVEELMRFYGRVVTIIPKPVTGEALAASIVAVLETPDWRGDRMPDENPYFSENRCNC